MAPKQGTRIDCITRPCVQISHMATGTALKLHLRQVGNDCGVEIDAVKAQLAIAIHSQQLSHYSHCCHQGPQYDVA